MSQSELAVFMQNNPEGALEEIAGHFSVSLLDVIRCLPEHYLVAGEHFDNIWQAVTGWGKVTTLVHNQDLVFEFTGELPAGSYGRGYFNFHGDKGFGGHIKAQHCQHIAFIERRFMGKETASIVFLNQQGYSMLKIFPGRDEHRKMLADQLEKFRQMARDLAQGSM